MSNNKEIEFLLELVKLNGVACSTVKDGHVLVFKREFLQNLLDGNGNKEFAIFVKRPDFSVNGN